MTVLEVPVRHAVGGPVQVVKGLRCVVVPLRPSGEEGLGDAAVTPDVVGPDRPFFVPRRVALTTPGHGLQEGVRVPVREEEDALTAMTIRPSGT